MIIYMKLSLALCYQSNYHHAGVRRRPPVKSPFFATETVLTIHVEFCIKSTYPPCRHAI